MATYIVNAPNKSQVTVTCKIGTYTYNHKEIMYDDIVAGYFPTLFIKLCDESPVQPEQPVVEAPVEVLVTEPVAAIPEPTPVTVIDQPEVKRRKGRPAGAKNKPKPPKE